MCKVYSKQKKFKICKKHGIELSETEKINPFLIHAKLGVYIAREKYNVEDSEVLSAIRWHTTGCGKMSDLEKIVYIADYIEPGRDKAPNLSLIRKEAFRNLDEGMYYILKDSLSYLASGTKVMDPATKEAFLYYESLHLNRKKKETIKHEQ